MENSIIKWLDLARIDIKNQGDGNDLKINVLIGDRCHFSKPQWFSKNGVGYVLETYDKHLLLELECHGKGELLIGLMGIDRRSPGGERIPLWVDYTRFAVNDEIVFWEIKTLWHDKHYSFRRQVVDGEKVKVEISLSNHSYKGDELMKLISTCRGLS